VCWAIDRWRTTHLRSRSRPHWDLSLLGQKPPQILSTGLQLRLDLDGFRLPHALLLLLLFLLGRRGVLRRRCRRVSGSRSTRRTRTRTLGLAWLTVSLNQGRAESVELGRENVWELLLDEREQGCGRRRGVGREREGVLPSAVFRRSPAGCMARASKSSKHDSPRSLIARRLPRGSPPGPLPSLSPPLPRPCPPSALRRRDRRWSRA